MAIVTRSQYKKKSLVFKSLPMHSGSRSSKDAVIANRKKQSASGSVSTSHARSIPYSPHPLARLPPEIREHIYTYVVTTSCRSLIRRPLQDPETEEGSMPLFDVSFLLVNRALYQETWRAFYANNTFTLEIPGQRIYWRVEGQLLSSYQGPLKRSRLPTPAALRCIKSLIVDVQMSHHRYRWRRCYDQALYYGLVCSKLKALVKSLMANGKGGHSLRELRVEYSDVLRDGTDTLWHQWPLPPSLTVRDIRRSPLPESFVCDGATCCSSRSAGPWINTEKECAMSVQEDQRCLNPLENLHGVRKATVRGRLYPEWAAKFEYLLQS